MRLICVLLIFLCSCSEKSTPAPQSSDKQSTVKSEKAKTPSPKIKEPAIELEKVNFTLLQPYGDFNKIYELKDNSVNLGKDNFANGLMMTATLPDKNVMQAKVNYVSTKTEYGVLIGSSMHIRIKTPAELQAFLDKNTFLKEQWGKQSSEWIKAGAKGKLSLKHELNKTYKLNITVDASNATNWFVSCDIKCPKEVTLPLILANAQKNGLVAPHQTISFSGSNMMRQAVINPVNDTLIVFADKEMEIYDVKTAKKLNSFAGHRGFTTLSQDNKNLSFLGDKELTIIDPENGKVKNKVAGRIAPSPDLKTGILRGDKSASIIALPSGKKVADIADRTGRDAILAFYPDMKHVVIEKRYKTTDIYDLSTGKIVSTLKDAREFNEMKIIKNGTELVAGGHMTGNKVRFWDAKTGEVLRTFQSFCSNKLAVSPDEKIIATSDWSTMYLQSIFLQDMEGKNLGILGPFEKSPGKLLFTSDSKYLVAIMAHSKDVFIWDLSKVIK